MRQANSRARDYRHPGHEEDILSAATFGLIKAVDRFDPDKGPLTTFADHWIRAELNEYVLNNLEPVRTITTKGQRRAFFGLNGQRQAIGADPTKPLTTAQIKKIAKALSSDATLVSERDVRQLDTNRMHGVSVSMSMLIGSHSSDGLEFGETLASPAPSTERQIDGRRELERVVEAFGKLDPRSQYIFEARRMADEGQEKTLHELAAQFNVSAERIRQIEEVADRKLRAAIGLEPKNKRAAAGRSKKSSAAQAALTS
jgi:RNA polymerase sigma-32 factor